mmetsp:Transcript_432/g.766  ORF Transcript_432/g.766 Transcript_432/m.766 type:complete len:115 (+) Transcript_432:63-407(+)
MISTPSYWMKRCARTCPPGKSCLPVARWQHMPFSRGLRHPLHYAAALTTSSLAIRHCPRRSKARSPQIQLQSLALCSTKQADVWQEVNRGRVGNIRRSAECDSECFFIDYLCSG